MENKALINKLYKEHTLTEEEYAHLITYRTNEDALLLRELANEVRKNIYHQDVYIRGLIEISNICKNDCYYCGIRKSNTCCSRYRLTEEEILHCCKEGYDLGIRTFVLQGGEDGYFSDEVLCKLLRKIKGLFSDCCITLSIGERDKESYQKLYDAGASRYLLRHETADAKHYALLHPESMSFDHRMQCLRDLKEIGYQVGCGFMVESPYSSVNTIVQDLKFIENFKPDMCGIGPYITHNDTPFNDQPSGSVELTCYLLSIIRLIYPNVLLPSTTALSTLAEDGREQGLLSGANVVMPNLSPMSVRKKYTLYNNKKATGSESAANLNELQKRIEAIGLKVALVRGDIIK